MLLSFSRALSFRAASVSPLSFQALSIRSARAMAAMMTTTKAATEGLSSPFANPALDSTIGGPPPPTSTSKTFVLFHSPCPDGAFAALAAWLHFKQASPSAFEGEEKVQFVPHRVYETMEVPASTSSSSSSSSPLASLSARDTVYLLDYSGPAGFPQALSQIAGRVVVLDHHKTAAEQLAGVIEAKAWTTKREGEEEGEEEEGEEEEEGTKGTDGDKSLRNLEVLLDQDRSGATLSAAHFNPPLTGGLRKAFAAIQDGDLWHWKLPRSKAFYAGLHSSGILDERVAKAPLEMLQKLSELDWDETVSRGEKEVEERDRAVAAEADKAFDFEKKEAVAEAEHKKELRNQ